MASDISPKMDAFLEVMQRNSRFVCWRAVDVAIRAGYSLTVGRNGASPDRTMRALERLGLVAETADGEWSLTQKGERRRG